MQTMTEHTCIDWSGAPQQGYGDAITEIDEHDDGTLWAGNGEYGTQVNFCPFCGYEAKTKVKAGAFPLDATVAVRLNGFYRRTTVVGYAATGEMIVRYHDGEEMREHVVTPDMLR
jgi:hypothetical protein